MDKDLEKMLTNKKLATYRVINWFGTVTKGEMCEDLGFTRPTLERRIQKHNWKLKEIKLILKNYPF